MMYDVIVCGGGPVGLVSACRLVKQGLLVLVLEKSDGRDVSSRASTFHPPTLECLEELGVADALLGAGIKCPTWQMRNYSTGEYVNFDLSAIADETRYPFRLQVEQAQVSDLLLQQLEEGGTHVLFGHEVEDCYNVQDGVEVKAKHNGEQVTFKGKYMIASDGAHSAVRRVLAVPFEGLTYPDVSVSAEVDCAFDELIEGLCPVTYCWSESFGGFSFLKLQDCWRFNYRVSQDIDEAKDIDSAVVERRLQEMLPSAEPYKINQVRVYNTHRRMIKKMCFDNIVFAGDAAHLSNPSGGMGMNSGIHDAMLATEMLVKILRDGQPKSLLGLYSRKRCEAVTAVLSQADFNYNRMKIRDAKIQAEELKRLKAMVDNKVALRTFLLNMSMIGGLRRMENIR